jgi:GT2 family glycosyltransferase
MEPHGIVNETLAKYFIFAGEGPPCAARQGRRAHCNPRDHLQSDPQSRRGPLSNSTHVVSKLVVLVSVIIPTFNRRALVREAVASACGQRDVELDVIVIDDGSSDGTAAALQDELGSRIRIFSTENRGVSAARNLGVRHSRGELIAFLDSDDVWQPGKLAAQVAFFAAHPEAHICQTEEIWIRNGVRVNPCKHHRKPSGDIFTPSLRRCLVSASAVMLRRSLFERVGGFDETLPACEDYDLWLRIACDTPVWLIDQPLVIKRGGHADQLSGRFWGMDRYRVAALARLLAEGRLSAPQRTQTMSVLAEKCAILANGAARRGHHDAAEHYRMLRESHAELPLLRREIR